MFPGVEDPKVAGFILLMTSPVFIEKRGCFTVAKFGTVCPIPGKSDTVMLKRLGGRLRI